MRTIAEQVGVSVSLVSRVLNGKADQFRVGDETKRAVLAAAKQQRYSVNKLARGLRLNRTNIIGLLVPNMSNYFFSSVARHIESAARKKGYSILIADSQDDESVERQSLRVLQGLMIDGLIVAPCGVHSDHLVSANEDRFPVVCVDGYFPGSGIPYVISDHFRGAIKATQYLLDRGHREIAFLQGYPGVQVNRDRLRGYQKALTDSGIRTRSGFVAGEKFNYESGYLAAKTLLRKKQCPTAIFSVNNEIALGAICAIKEEGLSVPEDISIVTFDEIQYASHSATPLTSVAHQMDVLGRRVVDLLDSRINGKLQLEGEGIVIPTGLVERGSVRDIRSGRS